MLLAHNRSSFFKKTVKKEGQECLTKLGILILVAFILLVGCSLFEKDKGNPYSRAIIYKDRVESEWAGIRYNIPEGHRCTEEDLFAIEMEMDSDDFAKGDEVNTDLGYELVSFGAKGGTVLMASMRTHPEEGKYIDIKGGEKQVLNVLKDIKDTEWIPSETKFCGNSYYMYETEYENNGSEDYDYVVLVQELGGDRLILISFEYSEQEDFDKMWNAFEPL